MSEPMSEGTETNTALGNQICNMTEALSASEVRKLIASRAYELYKQRGAEAGNELNDWLTAEAEVVTMLLAEPQASNEITGKPRNRKAIGASKTASGARRIASQWSKRKNALKGDPAQT